MSGKLIGIARAPVKLGPLEELDEAEIAVASGIEGDARGTKARRQISILFRDGWEDACRDVAVDLPWVTRRANLYVDGMERPREVGGYFTIGEVRLEVVCETDPCNLMERAQAGLYNALSPDWRGGVCCRVLSGGTIRRGDAVSYGR